MSKNTAGPWIYIGNGDIVARSENYCGDEKDIAQVYLTSNDEDEYNARLIAAAPDLLEALRDALSVLASVSMTRDRRVVRDGCALYLQTEEWCLWAEDEVGSKVRSAIAKATGEAL